MAVVDAELWSRAASGDRHAFAAVCDQTWLDLYRFVFWRVQNREEAEDITQETYARLLAALPRLRNRHGSAEGLLRIIAANIIRDGWRRRRARGQPPALDLVVEPPAPDEVASIEHRLMVQNALTRLPADQRTVIELRLLKGYSVRHTARLIGKTEAAVRSLQYRGLVAMAESLEIDRRKQGGDRRGLARS